jgi:ribosomal protein S12 methylthiotransferase
MKNSSKIIPYFDIPLQHISKKVLSSMGRTGSFSSYINLVEKIRKSFKDSCLRSTFIVGFPTETKDDFNELKEFLKDAELDNVGFFKYSKEEGTRSFSYKDEMSEEEKEERLSEVADLQRKISLKRNKAKVGKKYEVLVDGLYEESDLLCEGRAFFQSPEIDGKIILNKGEFKIGEFHTVKITRAFEYDLVGELCASNKV